MFNVDLQFEGIIKRDSMHFAETPEAKLRQANVFYKLGEAAVTLKFLLNASHAHEDPAQFVGTENSPANANWWKKANQKMSDLWSESSSSFRMRFSTAISASSFALPALSPQPKAGSLMLPTVKSTWHASVAPAAASLPPVTQLPQAASKFKPTPAELWA